MVSKFILSMFVGTHTLIELFSIWTFPHIYVDEFQFNVNNFSNLRFISLNANEYISCHCYC